MNAALQKQDKSYDLSTFKVLIIEDSQFIAGLLSSSLKEMGVGKAMTVININQAKEKITELNANIAKKGDSIDVIILDWLMPGGNGLELLQWIRAHKNDTIKFLPIIICSAFASAELVEESRDNGANETIVKPVSANKLAQRILYVIDKQRPFIACKDFFGPDRRRKTDKFPGDEKRTLKPEEIEEDHEQLQ